MYDMTLELVQAGIMVIIQQVEAGTLSPADAETRMNARLTELTTDADRAAYQRLIAQTAMLARS